MRKLFLLFTIVFTLCLSAHSQINSKCPFFLIGSEFATVDDVIEAKTNRDRAGEANFTVIVGTNDNNTQNFTYKWDVPQNFTFKNTRSNEILVTFSSSRQIPETVSVSVEVSGLPENCQKVFSRNFKLQITAQNPGSPVPLEHYEKLLLREEKRRLSKVAEYFLNEKKNITEVCLQIVIYEPTKKSLSQRKIFIENYLKEKNLVSKRDYTLTGDIDEKKVFIYFWGFKCLNTR